MGSDGDLCQVLCYRGRLGKNICREMLDRDEFVEEGKADGVISGQHSAAHVLTLDQQSQHATM